MLGVGHGLANGFANVHKHGTTVTTTTSVGSLKQRFECELAVADTDEADQSHNPSSRISCVSSNHSRSRANSCTATTNGVNNHHHCTAVGSHRSPPDGFSGSGVTDSSGKHSGASSTLDDGGLCCSKPSPLAMSLKDRLSSASAKSAAVRKIVIPKRDAYSE